MSQVLRLMFLSFFWIISQAFKVDSCNIMGNKIHVFSKGYIPLLSYLTVQEIVKCQDLFLTDGEIVKIHVVMSFSFSGFLQDEVTSTQNNILSFAPSHSVQQLSSPSPPLSYIDVFFCARIISMGTYTRI